MFSELQSRANAGLGLQYQSLSFFKATCNAVMPHTIYTDLYVCIQYIAVPKQFLKMDSICCFFFFCGLYFRVECGLYITDTSAHRILSSAIRPLCCTSVIKFLCVPEIMETILLFPLSRCAIFPLRCLPLIPSPLYSLWFYCRGHWQHTPHTHTHTPNVRTTNKHSHTNNKTANYRCCKYQKSRHRNTV